MKKLWVTLFAVLFAIVGLAAQEKMEKKEKKAKTTTASTKEDRWHGVIVRSSKDQSSLTVRKGNIEKTVVFNDQTKWTNFNKDSDMATVAKDGADVICLGHYDEKGRLVATRIDLRPPK